MHLLNAVYFISSEQPLQSSKGRWNYLLVYGPVCIYCKEQMKLNEPPPSMKIKML